MEKGKEGSKHQPLQDFIGNSTSSACDFLAMPM
jgi:hypothetical protein